MDTSAKRVFLPRSVIYIGNDAVELQTLVNRVVEKESLQRKLIRASVVDLLLQAEAGEVPPLPDFNQYRPEDDNKYDVITFDPSAVTRDERSTLICVVKLEYLLMEMISEVARKAVRTWLEKLIELKDDVDLMVIASLNRNALTEKSRQEQKKIEKLFTRVVYVADLVAKKEFTLDRSRAPQDFWKGVVGYSAAKTSLEKLVRWRWYRQADFNRLGLSASPGVLLVGPSGCGKTKLANHLGTEPGVTFISLKASDVFSKWYGESERALRDAFAKARASRPCILFLDELESLAPERADQSDEALSGGVGVRVLSTLLNELDGVDSDNAGLVVIGATNELSNVDKAIVRPGRLGSIVEIGLPSKFDRIDLFKNFLGKAQISLDVTWDQLVDSCEGYSVAKIESVCSAAAYAALWEGCDHIAQRHFDQTMNPLETLL